MTAPRQVLPGRIYLLTRRCTQRQFLLRPDKATNRNFLYCLAEAAKRYGIELIAWCAMSNHWHGVVYDPHGRLPAFLERFHKLTAKALNARWGRWENFWASEQTSAVYLVEHQDVVDKVVYTLTNPVADHLVERVLAWPGVSSLQLMGRRPLTLRRPKGFFREAGPMPAEVTITPRTPHGCEPRAWAEEIRLAVQARERAVLEKRLATGVRITGRRQILRTSPLDRPRTTERRRGLRPNIACKNAERRRHELLALGHFRAAYRSARESLAKGQTSVLFPAGTYMLRLVGIARCVADSLSVSA